MTTTVLGHASRGLVLGACFAGTALAQDSTEKEKKPYSPPPLFAETKPIEFTITGPIAKIRKERTGTPNYYPGKVTYKGENGEVSVPVRLRARGIWRRKNCEIPPLLMNFTKDSTKGTLFGKLDRARLTFPCKFSADYEQYVLQEFQLYRAQRVMTPYSFDVRLAKVTYVDPEKNDTYGPYWSFLSEQDDVFAERNGAKLITQQGAGPGDLHSQENAFFGVWQYFVANADYSVRALHNVVLIFKDGEYIPVARDFDFGGAVNTRYANPPPQLGIKKVTDRLMRGYCEPGEQYMKAFELFRAKKDEMYALYKDELNANMKEDVVKRTLEYFDDFYAIINDPRKADRNIVKACLGSAAGS